MPAVHRGASGHYQHFEIIATTKARAASTAINLKAGGKTTRLPGGIAIIAQRGAASGEGFIQHQVNGLYQLFYMLGRKPPHERERT